MKRNFLLSILFSNLLFGINTINADTNKAGINIVSSDDFRVRSECVESVQSNIPLSQ